MATLSDDELLAQATELLVPLDPEVISDLKTHFEASGEALKPLGVDSFTAEEFLPSYKRRRLQ